MFEMIKRVFGKKDKNKIERFSTTLTSAKEGVDKREDLNVKMKELLSKVSEEKNITSEDLNSLCSYFFNVAEIKPGIYNFNKAMTDGMCFTINDVKNIYENGELIDIQLHMSDVIFNNALKIIISVKDFHEIFSQISLPNLIKENQNNDH